MKLYFSEGACSMASHIALNEAGIAYTPKPMRFDQGDFNNPHFLNLNPMGAVPVLELDNGQSLTEGVAIMEYIASLNPEANLAPKYGTFEYFKFKQWMNFISTEMHKGFSPLYSVSHMTKDESAQQEIKNFVLHNLDEKFAVLDQALAKSDFICGIHYTVADGYLFTIMSWAPWMNIDYSKYKNLAAYIARIGERPAVLKTIELEEKLCN